MAQDHYEHTQPYGSSPKTDLQNLKEGDVVHDFRIVRPLGKGAFGCVYLAVQISLGRQIALKISENFGNEGQTLARFEHELIVQVFSETVDPSGNWRLLCMQFVPGATLEKIIRDLPEQWSGRTFLKVIDQNTLDSPQFDPAALKIRDAYETLTKSETICHVGAQIADALAYAHRQNILHCDIKPANILISQYGRPLLADFNVSLNRQEADRLIGGTTAYLAPEYLESMLDQGSPVPVGPAADIYSLALVLWEFASGVRPFDVRTSEDRKTAIRELIIQRKAGVQVKATDDQVPIRLMRVLEKCLNPEPPRRWQSADQLAAALRGVGELEAVKCRLAPDNWFARVAANHPTLGMVCVAFFPQLIGSAFNIMYNGLRIVSRLTVDQQQSFGRIVFGYNCVVYPVCLLVIFVAFTPVQEVLRKQKRPQGMSDDLLESTRRRVLGWPMLVVAVACFGWFTGGPVFPMILDSQSDSLPASVYGHFILSFTFSGLIALTYSYFGVQYFVLRGFYLRFWGSETSPLSTAEKELVRLPARLKFFQFLAGSIPLSAAVMLVAMGPDQFGEGYFLFRAVVSGLIILGMGGFWLATLVRQRLDEFIQTLRPIVTTDRGSHLLLR